MGIFPQNPQRQICYTSKMNIEVEAKFLNLNHEEMRKRLQDIGAVCVTPMRLMRRAIIDYADRRLQAGDVNSYIRVRDEGDKITLTYKQFNSLSVDGAQEIEVEVSSFEDTISIFTSIGLEVSSLQESKRETWKYRDCEIVLDEWPWLHPYIEIESDSKEKLESLATQLHLDWNDAVFGDVMVAYRAEYPHLTAEQTIGKVPKVTFGSPLPSFLNEQ